MDCKAERHWHIITNGDNCPKTRDVVVGVWISTTETMAELCCYDQETHEWFSANPDTKGYALMEPDYWIEFPD